MEIVLIHYGFSDLLISIVPSVPVPICYVLFKKRAGVFY